MKDKETELTDEISNADELNSDKENESDSDAVSNAENVSDEDNATENDADDSSTDSVPDEDNATENDADNESVDTAAGSDEDADNESVDTAAGSDEDADNESVDTAAGSDEDADNESVDTAAGSDEDADADESDSEPVPKKNFFVKIKDTSAAVFNACGLRDFLFMRFLGLFMLASGICLKCIRFAGTESADPINNWQGFVEKSMPGTVVLIVLIGIVLLSVLYAVIPKKIRLFDQAFCIGGTLYFTLMMMWKNDNFYNCLGASAILMVFSIYALSKSNHERLEKFPKWATAAITIAVAVLVCGFVAATSLFHHKVFGTSSDDMGIFTQMFHYMSTDLTGVTTCERDTFISHFNVHASYILYALLPFYYLFPGAGTLIISQAILAMGGIIPLWLILKNHNFSGVPRIGAAFIYIFCAGFAAPCYYDFHENAFLPTLIMWMLYAVDKKKLSLFAVMAVLTCIVKEDAPLYVMCIALFYFFEEKRALRRTGVLAICIGSLVYFVCIMKWLVANGDGSMMTATRFSILTIDPDAGFVGITKNVLTNPAYFFSLFFREESLLFFVRMFVPMLFLPLMTKKISRYILTIPFVIMNLVIGAGYGYAANVGFQYIFGPICILIYMAVINAADFDHERRNNYVIVSGLVSIIFLTCTVSGNISYITGYNLQKERFTGMEECLESIPQDASVACNVWYAPHIADRDEIYRFDNNNFNVNPDDETDKHLKDPMRYDFFVLSGKDENTPYAIADLEQSGFIKFNEYADDIIIYQSPEYKMSEAE